MQIVRRKTAKTKKSLEERFGFPEIDPVEYRHNELKTRVAIFDSETDPFLIGRSPKPFTCGIYFPDTKEYFDFWGDDCIAQFAYFMEQFEPETISVFVHNGGNFDFYFLVDYFDKGHSPFIINGRLVRVKIFGQEFRDSYAMIPVALGEYQKTDIDYRCMEREFREVFKEKIRGYQKDDCIFLSDLVVNWLDMFGNKLTMASVALPMLQSYHGFETLPPSTDKQMRAYYFGGRNQCFTTGVLHGDFKIYDINSSYPNVMKRFKHPVSGVPIIEKTLDLEKTHFAHIRAWSLGALPIRGKGGALNFPVGVNDFFACIHEIKAGLETGTLKIYKVYETIRFSQEGSFEDFIDEFYKLRLKAKGKGDKIRTLFYKLVMNSSYGKFAQDPRKYENWIFNPSEMPSPSYCDPCNLKVQLELPYECVCKEERSPYGWALHTRHNEIDIWSAPQKLRANSFFNVATAASITSAARAQLLRGIQAAKRPVYCDTDSVICEGWDSDKAKLYGIELDEHNLGAWDIEAEGDILAIGGKKLYALWNKNEPIKKASKGVKLTPDEIRRVAEGDCVEYAQPVPKFRLGKEPLFTTRNISATG